VSTHKKHKKRFSFFFFLFSTWPSTSIGASTRHTPTPPTGARSQFLNRAGPALNSVYATCAGLCCARVMSARRFECSVSQQHRPGEQQQHDETYTPESQSKNLRQDAQPSVRRGILLLLDSAAPSVTAHEFNRFFFKYRRLFCSPLGRITPPNISYFREPINHVLRHFEN
jgi:hypothetical protein